MGMTSITNLSNDVSLKVTIVKHDIRPNLGNNRDSAT